MAKMQIKGVIPPMITPFMENGDVDYDSHVRNMERWNKDKLVGYLVLGSNSEAAYLSEDEKVKMVELTVKHAKQDRIVLAGWNLPGKPSNSPTKQPNWVLTEP